MLLFLVLSFEHLMEGLSLEGAGSWPHPFPCDGLESSLVTKSLPPPSDPENPPLLFQGYLIAQRASLEADLVFWPWPFFLHRSITVSPDP